MAPHQLSTRLTTVTVLDAVGARAVPFEHFDRFGRLGRREPVGQSADSTPPGSQAAQPPTGPDAPPSSSPTHTVAPGESLWSITARLLPAGSGPARIAQAWPALYRANSGVIGADPSLIRPGTVLSVPDSLSAPSTPAGGQTPSR